MRRYRMTLIAALSVPLLAGCGSGSKNTAASSTSSPAGASTTRQSSSGGSGGASKARANPCSLLTIQEATTALGEPTDAGKATNSPVPGCLWPATNGASFADSVQLQVQDTDIFDGTLRGRDNPQVAAAFTFEMVSGVGDQAFFQIPKATGTLQDILLGFKKNGVAIYVSVHNRNLSVDQVKAADRGMALAAAGRV